MSNRSRSQDLRSYSSGSYKRYWNGQLIVDKTDGMWTGVRRSCDDTVGQWTSDNGLEIHRKQTSYPKLNGSDGTTSKVVYDNYPITYRPECVSPTSYFGDPDLAALASQAAGATNPSTPVVSIPAFLGEARELPDLLASIPDLLHFRGRGLMGLMSPKTRDPQTGLAIPNFLGGFGDANLAWRFGWKPMVADLLDMLGFVDAVNQRLGMLNALLAGKSIKRRMSLPATASVVVDGVKTTHSDGCIIKHNRKIRYYKREWMTTRWSLDPARVGELPKGGADEMLWWAFRHAYGITSFGMFRALWELVPWSWFIDWFWNLGSWINANDRTLPMKLVSCCWMRMSRASVLYDLVQAPPGNITCSGEYYQEWEAKQRRGISPLLAQLPPFLPSMPRLTPGQWSILGSLCFQGRR